jgi:hypothetical protein
VRLTLIFLCVACALATIAAGTYDLFGEPARSGLLHTGGELWFALSPNTLNLMQAVTQRYVSPVLWDPVIVAVLKLPAVAVLGLLTALLAAYPVFRALNSRPS